PPAPPWLAPRSARPSTGSGGRRREPPAVSVINGFTGQAEAAGFPGAVTSAARGLWALGPVRWDRGHTGPAAGPAAAGAPAGHTGRMPHSGPGAARGYQQSLVRDSRRGHSAAWGVA